jgi:hypothetical protein
MLHSVGAVQQTALDRLCVAALLILLLLLQVGCVGCDQDADVC